MYRMSNRHIQHYHQSDCVYCVSELPSRHMEQCDIGFNMRRMPDRHIQHNHRSDCVYSVSELPSRDME